MNEIIGKICPYCHSVLTADDEIVVCSSCKMPHHKECWIENKGCTTFGCQGTVEGITFEQDLQTSSTPKYSVRRDANIFESSSSDCGKSGTPLIPKGGNNMKIVIGILGLLIAVTFLIVGITTRIPDRYINVFGIEKYVGGDAYNNIIEASILGGERGGIMVSKAIYFAASAIVLLLSCMLLLSGGKGKAKSNDSGSQQIKFKHEKEEHSATSLSDENSVESMTDAGFSETNTAEAAL